MSKSFMVYVLWLMVLMGLFTIFHLLYTPAVVFAQDPNVQAAPGILQFQELIQRVINISVGLAFFFSTTYLVWSGIKFITSGGEAKALADAWRVFTWALLGILFLVFAWLTLLLIERFTGASVTKFCFGFPGAPTACPFN